MKQGLKEGKRLFCCLRRHKATQKLFAVSHIGVVPKAECFCVCKLRCCSSHLKKDQSHLESVIICGFVPTTGKETWDAPWCPAVCYCQKERDDLSYKKHKKSASEDTVTAGECSVFVECVCAQKQMCACAGGHVCKKSSMCLYTSDFTILI